MSNIISINQKISSFRKKTIFVEGDKSLSIRFILLSSLSNGKCTAYNLLKSEDVLCTINSIKKLGIKINLKNNYCEVFGRGLFGLKYKNGLVLDAGNSGTTARLLCSLLIDTDQKIKITGDKSLKKRDMSRITRPLRMFGANLEDNKGKLPITIKETEAIIERITASITTYLTLHKTFSNLFSI